MMIFKFLSQLREMVKEKWNQHIPNVAGGRRFSMRFPNSTKVECTIDEATPKVLEVVLIVGYKHCLSNNCTGLVCDRICIWKL